MNMKKKLINVLALGVLVFGITKSMSLYADDDYKDAAKAQKKADKAEVKAAEANAKASKKIRKSEQKQDKIKEKQDKKIDRELDKAN